MELHLGILCTAYGFKLLEWFRKKISRGKYTYGNEQWPEAACLGKEY